MEMNRRSHKNNLEKFESLSRSSEMLEREMEDTNIYIYIYIYNSYHIRKHMCQRM